MSVLPSRPRAALAGAFPARRRLAPRRMAGLARPDRLSARPRRDGIARRRHRRGERARAGLARRTSPTLHRGDERQAGRPSRRALSRLSRRARRAVHLSRAGTAGGLRDARSQAPPPRRARIRRRAGGVADRRAQDFRRQRRNARDRVGVWVARPDKPGGIDGAMAEDKIAAIGIRVRRWTSFHGVSLNVAPDLTPFPGHRALRDSRTTLRRHQPRRPRPQRVDGGRRRRAAPRFRGALRSDRFGVSRLKSICAATRDAVWRAGRTSPRNASRSTSATFSSTSPRHVRRP